MNPCRFPDESKPFFLRYRWLAVLLISLGGVVFAIAIGSLLTRSILFPYDQSLDQQFAAIDKTLPASFMTASTYFANISTVLPTVFALIFSYIFLRKGCDDRFMLLLLSYGVGMLFFFILGLALNRERPDLPGLLAEFPFPSFPSGHMIQTMTLLIPILYLYLPEVRSSGMRTAILILAVLYVLVLAADRLVTNAHYLTDVLGGIGISLFWSFAVLVGFELYHLSNQQRKVRAG